jgi:hypothetical protein
MIQGRRASPARLQVVRHDPRTKLLGLVLAGDFSAIEQGSGILRSRLGLQMAVVIGFVLYQVLTTPWTLVVFLSLAVVALLIALFLQMKPHKGLPSITK